MFKVTKYPHSTFSWADCSSTDAAVGKTFYSELMGWTTEDIPMGDGTFYTFFKKDGETVAAISPMPQAMKDQGMYSVWNSYITVDDVDVMHAKAKEHGGTVMGEPIDVFDNGRMLVLQDPTGAVVSLWQPKSHIGASLVNTVGALSWNELYTRDMPKATDFYSKLLGWDIDKVDGMEYWVASVKGRQNAGMMPIRDEWGEMPPHWMAYFAVADIEAATDKVEKLGGKVHSRLIDMGDVGRGSVIADPAGAVLTIIQINKPDPWIE